MISLYFGLPGSGKSTIATALAVREGDRILSGKSRYKYVYCNFPVNHPAVLPLRFDWLGKYDIRDALVVIDEATLYADSRDHKSFRYQTKEFFLLHRHFKVDIALFCQQWDSVDKKIRVITDSVYYVYKGRLTGKFFTRMYKVPYGIIIPDPKKDSSEKLGEIVQGYCKPSFLSRLLSPWFFRPRWYKYFDSFATPEYPPIPPDQLKLS